MSAPWIAPQLLTVAKAAPPGDGWLHEIKYDGYRLLCRVEHGRARFFTRPGNDWTSELPGLAVPVAGPVASGPWPRRRPTCFRAAICAA